MCIRDRRERERERQTRATTQHGGRRRLVAAVGGMAGISKRHRYIKNPPPLTPIAPIPIPSLSASPSLPQPQVVSLDVPGSRNGAVSLVVSGLRFRDRVEGKPGDLGQEVGGDRLAEQRGVVDELHGHEAVLHLGLERRVHLVTSHEPEVN